MSAHTDLTHDQICAALYGLGAAHLVWDALPDAHDLAIVNLRLEDATGTVLPWFAQVCEDGAYDLADEISDEPGTYVLSLPDGAWSHIITGYRWSHVMTGYRDPAAAGPHGQLAAHDPSDPRYLDLESEE